MFMNFRTLAILAAAFILAACGGGGARDAGAPVRDAPDFDPDFDTVVVGDVLFGAQDRLYRAESQCSGSTCTVTYLDISVMVDLGDIDPSASTATIADRQLRNGVWTGTGRVTAGDGDIRFDAFGVWGDYNAATTGAGVMTLQGADVPFAVPTSLGYGNAANPVSGSASWAGMMTGVKFGSSGLGAAVAGEAAMIVDFDGAALDLEFTNIAELLSGAGVGDISWQDVPMQAGSFEDVGLNGRFYGPNHEEAGGVFERDGVAGAFSLKRD